MPLLGFFRFEGPAKISDPAIARLTFEGRVAYQRAIEDVYWRHRIWPKERPDPKPSLDAVMSQAQLENKVAGYLCDSQALEDYWQRPITAEQLQAEMDRMARDTNQPEVLRELFEALGSDPFVIAECLARPALVERDLAIAESRRPSLEGSQAKVKTKSRYVPNANYALPTISDGTTGCTPDTWTPTSITNAPAARGVHTAVWTGSEMIVWGGYDGIVHLNTGGIYKPSVGSWVATSTTNAPEARDLQTVVWTGSEMVVWGGYPATNTGGRYNPGTDSWVATSTTNAPVPRYEHAAVWTANEMIIWGGFDSGSNYLNTGGRYNPSTDSWTPTSTTNAPSARSGHTAVWTGSDMIIWGGAHDFGISNTGGRYNRGTDSWTATSTTNALHARFFHTAVWTDSEMIVWGGTNNLEQFNTGGRYNPGSDSWVATSTTNTSTGREFHTAVWTGNEMIVWGGADTINYFNTGGKYCAVSGAPTPTPTPAPITLSAAGRKVGGINTVRLTWSGATSSQVDIYRNGVVIVTTANDDTYVDSTGDTGRARYRYRVCEAGTSTCSNDARVTFQQ
jgi:Galactose oxidase, central domain